MRTLAIDTASEACSVALFEGGKRIAHDHRELGRGHAERLIPMIEALPDAGRADRILVSLGPGSFTGVRIGIAAARALGVAWRAEVLGYPTLALIAAMSKAPAVTVCMNGGHGEWFVQGFEEGSAQAPARSMTPEAAQEAGAHPVIAGNRAQAFAELLGGAREVRDILPDAEEVMRLPETAFSSDLSPIYGRAPDAKPQTVPVP